MMQYNVVYVLVWLLAIMSIKRIDLPSRAIYVVQVGIVALFVGLKFQTGYDWPIYEAHYESVQAGDKFYLDFEFGYEWIVHIASTLGLAFQHFSAAISILEVVLIAFAVKHFFPKYSLVIMALLYSIPDFYLIPTFSLLRQGLAVSIFLIGICWYCSGRKLAAIGVFALACSMHYSVFGGILMFAVLGLFPINRSTFLLIFGVSIALYVSSLDVIRAVVQVLIVYVNPKYMIYLDRDVFNASFAYRAAFALVSFIIFSSIYAASRRLALVDPNWKVDNQLIYRLAFLGVLIPLVMFGFPTLSTRYQYFFAIFIVGAAISSLVYVTYASRLIVILVIAIVAYLPFYRFLSSPLSIVYIPYQSQLFYDKENSTGQERTSDLLNQLDVLWSK